MPVHGRGQSARPGAGTGRLAIAGAQGFVILPIVGNAAEHSTAILFAWRCKMDVAFGVALGSSTQIALFAVPTMVLLAIPLGQPLDLFFGAFEIGVLFVSALLVASVRGGLPPMPAAGRWLVVSCSAACESHRLPRAASACPWRALAIRPYPRHTALSVLHRCCQSL